MDFLFPRNGGALPAAHGDGAPGEPVRAIMPEKRSSAIKERNVIELPSPRRKPGSRKPHPYRMRAFAGMTLEGWVNSIMLKPTPLPG
jgi:hypothetical protein